MWFTDTEETTETTETVTMETVTLVQEEFDGEVTVTESHTSSVEMSPTFIKQLLPSLEVKEGETARWVIQEFLPSLPEFLIRIFFSREWIYLNL